MTLVATLAERILDAIRYGPLDDDVLAKRLGLRHRQSVNAVARNLEMQGRLQRNSGPDGKIVNALPNGTVHQTPEPALVIEATSPTPGPPAPPAGDANRITEDEVKEAVCAHLTALGFEVAVAWGHHRGIDVDARHPDGRRYVIEAKAEVGKNSAQQVNYFLGMLGELVQRMEDSHASYGIALPGNRQYRGLVNRLPPLVRERLKLVVFWVSRHNGELVVDVES